MNINKMVCVVTGAGGNVGKAVVETLLEKQAKVVAVFRGETSNLAETDVNHYSIKSNLADMGSVQTVVDNILDKLGNVQVWINAVGGFQEGQTIEEVSSDQWQNMLSINFITVLNCCQAIIPSMKEQHFGRIINFGSSPGEDGMALAAPYAVSKAAVHALSKTIAQEGKKFNVIPRVLMPGIIDTPENRNAMPTADWSQWISPNDIAQTILSLIEQDKFKEDTDNVLVPVQVKSEKTPEQKEDLDILAVFNQKADIESETETSADEDKSIPEEESERKIEKQESAPVDEEAVLAEETVEEDSSLAEETQKGEEALLEEESRDTLSIKPQLATFTLVAVYKKQELYQQALDVLDILEQKGEYPERISEKRTEILALLESEGETIEPETTEPLEKSIAEEAKTGSGEAEPVEEEEEMEEESITFDPDKASFQDVVYLKSRGSYQQALEMLEVLAQKGEDSERIEQEKQEILEMLEFVKEETQSSEEGVSPEQLPPEEVPATEDTPAPESEYEQVIEAESAATMEAEPVEPSTGKKPERKKISIRNSAYALAVILIIVSGYTIWKWLSPETPSSLRSIPSGDQSEETDEYTLSQFALPPLEPIEDSEEGIVSSEERGLLLPATDEVSAETGDTGRVAIIDSFKIEEHKPTTVVATPIEEYNEPSSEEKPVAIMKDEADSIPLSGVVEEPETVSKLKDHETIETETIEGELESQDPWELFYKAQYQEAAGLWRVEKSATPDHYTVALEFACLNQTIRKAFNVMNQAEDFFLLPYQLDDKVCFIFCWGDFPDLATAEEQLLEVPRWFEETGATPVVRPFSKLLR